MWKCLCVRCTLYNGTYSTYFVCASFYWYFMLLFHIYFLNLEIFGIGMKSDEWERGAGRRKKLKSINIYQMAFYFWPKWKLKEHIINGIKKGIKCEYICECVCVRATIRFIFLKSGLSNNWQDDDFHVLFPLHISHSRTLILLHFFVDAHMQNSHEKIHAQMKI